MTNEISRPTIFFILNTPICIVIFPAPPSFVPIELGEKQLELATTTLADSHTTNPYVLQIWTGNPDNSYSTCMVVNAGLASYVGLHIYLEFEARNRAQFAVRFNQVT